jgi:hypothetical protein
MFGHQKEFRVTASNHGGEGASRKDFSRDHQTELNPACPHGIRLCGVHHQVAGRKAHQRKKDAKAYHVLGNDF